MFIKYALWVRETTATKGTGNITLSGPITGFASFSSQLSVGDECIYAISDGDAREIGVGEILAGNVLQRKEIRATLDAAGTFTANPATGLALTGSAVVSCTDDAILLTWASGIRKNTTNQVGEVLMVNASGISELSDTIDGGVVP